MPATRPAGARSAAGPPSQGRSQQDEICEAAGAYRDRLAWGAAIAAWGRELAGNQAAHTALACEAFGGISGDDAAHVLRVGRREIVGSASSVPMQAWCSHFAATITAGRHRHV